jgi:hypothetical protein
LSPKGVRPLKIDDPRVWLRDVLLAFDLELADRPPRREYAKIAAGLDEGEGRHNTLLSFAGKIWVEGLSPEAFVAALEAVNSHQFATPLPADEVEAIARWFMEGREQAGRNGHREDDEAMWASLGAGTPALTPVSQNGAAAIGHSWQPAPLPDDHYVPRYVQYASSRTDAPPQYHELLAVVQLSAVVGRSMRIPLAAKPQGMYCNLWAMLLGDSTLFRKSTSEDLAVDLLRTIETAMFLANDQSPQGFVEEMALRDGQPCVWHRDEFRSFLAQLKHATWMAGGKELLMKFYDGSSYYRRLRTKRHKGEEFPDEAKVDSPYLVVVAAGVTSRIVDVLTVDDIVDGFLPRFLITAPKERPPRRRAATITEAIEAERRALIEQLRGVHRGFKERGECVVNFEPEAWEHWNAYAARIEEQAGASPSPELFGPIAGRIADTALKVAALFQAAEGAPARGSNLRVTMPMLKAAIAMCEQLRRDAEELAMEIGSSMNERKLSRFVEMVKRQPGMQRTMVARSLKLDKREMDNLEATALDRELITCGTKNTRGRSAKGYWYVGEDGDAATT